MLATAVGSALTKHMHELLDLMFAYGLSESLVMALQDLATNIPPLLPTIQGTSISSRDSTVPPGVDETDVLCNDLERLLNLLCLILAGEPFKTPGAPLQPRPHASTITRDVATLNVGAAPLWAFSPAEFLSYVIYRAHRSLPMLRP